jgi:soluble lytic murein transglycosylase
LGILDQLIPAIQAQESGNNPAAVSPMGAFGLMQLMPATAADPGFGVTPFNWNAADLKKENQRFGRDYFTALYKNYGGDVPTALMAYNWGPTNVQKWLDSNRTLPVPKETQNYVTKVMSRVKPADAQTSNAAAKTVLAASTISRGFTTAGAAIGSGMAATE